MRLIPDLKFRVILVGISFLHFLVAYLFEVFLLVEILFKIHFFVTFQSYIIERDFLEGTKSKNKVYSAEEEVLDEGNHKFENYHNQIEYELKKNKFWPQIVADSSDLYNVPIKVDSSASSNIN